MPVDCCGKARKSPFCPDCGSKLVAGPLLDVLAYCRLQEKRARRLAKKWRKSATSSAGPDYPGWAAREEARADRWKSWADAVADLMADEKSPNYP